MLLYARLVQRFSVQQNFKVDAFTSQDYKTMCHLLRQRYLIHNDDIKIFKDVKLLDENNKLIGLYPASEARKKAYSMKKDITLINQSSDPVVCRTVSFRNDLLNKFFTEIVHKQNQKLLSRANTTKELKVSLNLNKNQLKVKAKQIIELSKKALSVKVFINCNQDTRDQCLEKLEYLKFEVQGKCFIDKDIKNYHEQSKDQKANQTQTYSFTCKSRDNQFKEALKQSAEKAPDEAILTFLKNYYKEDDVDMLDLKATGKTLAEDIFKVTQTPTQSKIIKDKVLNLGIKGKGKGKGQGQGQGQGKGKGQWKEPTIYQNSLTQKQAQARILNYRLKVLLGWVL